MAFEFNNPLLYELREGSGLDPFVPLSTTSVIISNKIVLSELPSPFEGVTISGYAESKISSGLIATTFYVNYLNGIVSFASSENGKTVTANFKGRGIIQIPAERIYSTDGNDVTQTLQNMINSGSVAIESLGGLSTAISTAQALETELDSDIATGNILKSDLDSQFITADVKKTALDLSISNSNTSKTNLDASISTSGVSKTALDSSNITANVTKSNLDSSNTTALATKDLLDGSNATALGTKTALDSSNTTANSTKSNLDGSISSATIINGTLDGTISTANISIGELNETNVTAQANEDTRQSNEETRIEQEENRQSTYSSGHINFKGVVTGKTSLPASSNILGDTYQVIDDAITANNAMWRYNGTIFEKSYVLDLTFAGGYGANNSQVFTATENQTLFTLTEFPYLIGVNQLMVYITGIKQIIGVNYTETSTNSFTLTSGVIVAGTKVEAFRSVPGGAGSLTTQEVESARVSSLGVGYPNLKARLDDHDSNKVGDLNGLPTVAKTDIVSAVNEFYDDVTSYQANYATVNVRQFGAVGDGLLLDGSINPSPTDDTQAFIDAFDFVTNNHYTLTTDYGKTYIVDGVVVDGKSNFGFNSKGILKRQDNLPATNSVVTTTKTLTFKNCSKFNIPLINFDGNALNNHCDPLANPYDDYTTYCPEVRHSFVLENCRDFNIEKITGTNPSGDLLFITGNQTDNYHIGIVDGTATEAIGRNALSIVEGKNFIIDTINSNGIGHFKMPGGFDIEPEVGQYVENGSIGNVNVKTGGYSGLSMGCRYGGGEQIKNVKIGSAIVNNSNIIESRICQIVGSTGVHIGLLKINGTSISTALNIGFSSSPQPVYDFNIDKLEIDGCFIGILADIYHGGFIKANIKNCHGEMFVPYEMENVKVDLTGTFHADATIGYCMRHAATGTLTKCRITGDLSKDSVGTKGTRCLTANRNDSSAVVDCELVDLNMEGWTTGTDILISPEYDKTKRYNCRGLTDINVYTGLDITTQTLPPVGTTLDSCTWPQISLISALGLGDTYFNVGDEKTLTLSTAEVLTIQIYGFNHDILSRDITKKIGITFGLKNLMAVSRQVNASNTNVGGWTASALKTWIDSTLTGQLPTDLQTALNKVIKFTSAGNMSSIIMPTIEKVFLLSEIELFGSVTNSANGEGTKYTIFTDDASRIKKLSNGVGVDTAYWQRSPRIASTTSFCLTTATGTLLYGNASVANGVAFGFCV